jgi:Amt family ammonium transporter
LCGVFATAAVSIGPDAPHGYAGLIEGNYNQLLIQLFAVVVTMVWSGAVTALLLKAVAAVTALRATQDEERGGLDISIHGEAIQ